MTKIRKANRIRARQPSKAKWWCGCDRSLVGHSGKCRTCGGVEKGTKDKKPGPLPKLLSE